MIRKLLVLVMFGMLTLGMFSFSGCETLGEWTGEGAEEVEEGAEEFEEGYEEGKSN